MIKEIVLDEAIYLEALHQAGIWKSHFERLRDRNLGVKTKLKSVRAENRKLQKELAAERQDHDPKIAALTMKLIKQSQEIEKQKSELETLRKTIFGSRSEKSKGTESPKDSPNTDATPKTSGRKRGKQKGGKGYGRRPRKNVKQVERVSDLKEDHKCCASCELPYRRSDKTDDSSYYEWLVEIRRVKVKRARYIRRCNCKTSPKFKTAPKQTKPIPKGMFAANFLAKLLVYHFHLQMPVNRVLSMMEMEGMAVSQGTVTGAFKALHPLFKPLYQEILKRAHYSNHWHMDETTWRMLCDPAKKRWWLWVVSAPDCVCFFVNPSRSSKIPKAFFGEDAEGILVVDRYAAYKNLGDKIRVAFCWAHVRRDFMKAQTYDKLQNWTAGWLKQIAKLYHLNGERLREKLSAKARVKAENALGKQVEAMEQKRIRELNAKKLHPQSKKILNSLRRHWEGLTVFVNHAWIPMDNNEAERALRNAVVGRKIYYGSGAEWSGELSAWLFSVFETLKKNNINMLTFMTEYLEACAQLGGNAPDDVSRFLPWHKPESEEQEQLA